jgi:hypothetical protein
MNEDQMRTAAQALAVGRTNEEAAKAAGVSVSTFYRYKRTPLYRQIASEVENALMSDALLHMAGETAAAGDIPLDGLNQEQFDRWLWAWVTRPDDVPDDVKAIRDYVGEPFDTDQRDFVSLAFTNLEPKHITRLKHYFEVALDDMRRRLGDSVPQPADVSDLVAGKPSDERAWYAPIKRWQQRIDDIRRQEDEEYKRTGVWSFGDGPAERRIGAPPGWVPTLSWASPKKPRRRSL